MEHFFEHSDRFTTKYKQVTPPTFLQKSNPYPKTKQYHELTYIKIENSSGFRNQTMPVSYSIHSLLLTASLESGNEITSIE